MSYTSIYTFDKSGNAHFYSAVKNSFRGAMAVWQTMEERYLPLYIPDYIKYCNWYHPGMTDEAIIARNGFKPSRLSPGLGSKSENLANEIWRLADNIKIPEDERIVLFTTFDDCLVKHENLGRVISAFDSFKGESSLPLQASILEEIAKKPDIIAVGWDQNSAVDISWGNRGGYNEETDESIPYNCLTGKDHYWLFDEIICDLNVEKWWHELADVPFDDPGPEEDMVLAEDWGYFDKGTKREDIWRWFDEHHSRGVAYLMGQRSSQ